ncbi:MAG TPA: amidohydrolase family protein [Nocardioides sp.]|uniref:amidohydrolase family protein n=1 Tax=Nocardioides sp. TaxID=35761 RepID=UPI002E36291E|nr:amidohydrolase family protein [Nocardioides sp.]HEX3931050.1 amidohydrolase family protein [Nocardioides sp.]
MIIDCHGHYTTAPAVHRSWRERQLGAYAAGVHPDPYRLPSDDDIAESLRDHQLRLAAQRGIDRTLFSPRASAMGHHRGDLAVSRAWAEANNDLIARVVELFPDDFAAVCQLPQTAGEPLAAAVAEVRRCAASGFVGLNLNPDPSGGAFSAPPLTDRYWYPLYEVMVELGMPAMVHVSASCNPALHATGGYYLAADTTVFMQLLEGDLFADFPDLRLVIPHGGGAVPYHWGRYRGLADTLSKPPLGEHLMRNVFFDTCVYHQPGIDLLVSVVDTDNILFGSEMVGAVRGVDPETGRGFDDTRRYVEAAPLSDEQRAAIYEGNARRVYPRLALSGS